MAVEVFYTWLEVQSIDVTFISPLNHLLSSVIGKSFISFISEWFGVLEVSSFLCLLWKHVS